MIIRINKISSLENSNHTFHNYHLENVKKGIIIPIPNKDLNSTLLSGVFIRDIWIDKKKLIESDKPIIFPKKYRSLIYK